MEKFALISVSDKRGIVALARHLVEHASYRILSTGGTAQFLRKHGIAVTDVSAHTGFPEMMEGRIKTLHPKVHGGLLCRRDNPEHLSQAVAHEIGLIDIVVANLYPFEATVARPNSSLEQAIERIDIGGPSMLRSAAKNHASVTVLCDPDDYRRFLEILDNPEQLKLLRQALAVKAFECTAAYDHAIAAYLSGQGETVDQAAIAGFPKRLSLSYPRAKVLRYGENPHQKAALYGTFLELFQQLQGKELSYNNILDITVATYLMGEFERPTVAILKHTNPCGVASADTLLQAWETALATDPQAAFGGIIAVNRTIDETLAKAILAIFCEVIIAPGITQEARELFINKKNIRLMVYSGTLERASQQVIRSVAGGLLVQDRDLQPVDPATFNAVGKRAPTAKEWTALRFGWRVVKHVTSNAVVYARGERTLGIGAGQMARVDSAQIAAWKAGQAKLSLGEAVVASDAFFPFPDGIRAAAAHGATAVIQPGGSVRDPEVIAAADEKDMAMVFTGIRHFCH